MNTRFWAYVNGGIVKLTLTPGETINHYTSEATEEGYRARHESWALDKQGTELDYSLNWRERDCDGMHSGYTNATCYVHADGRAKAGQACSEDITIVFPAWEGVKQQTRDHAAEAMGY